MKVTDIHPLDLGNLLHEMDCPRIIINDGGEWKGEFVTVDGKKYRQTTDVPVVSKYGKELLGEL